MSSYRKTTVKVLSNFVNWDEPEEYDIDAGTTCRELVASVLHRHGMMSRDPNLFYMTLDSPISTAKDSKAMGVHNSVSLSDDNRPLLLMDSYPHARFTMHMRSGGLIKIYDSCLVPGSYYKSLFISKRTTSREVISLLLASYNISESPNNFVLSERNAKNKELCELKSADLPLSVVQSKKNITIHLKRVTQIVKTTRSSSKNSSSKLTRSHTFQGEEDLRKKHGITIDSTIAKLRDSFRRLQQKGAASGSGETERDRGVERRPDLPPKGVSRLTRSNSDRQRGATGTVDGGLEESFGTPRRKIRSAHNTPRGGLQDTKMSVNSYSFHEADLNSGIAGGSFSARTNREYKPLPVYVRRDDSDSPSRRHIDEKELREKTDLLLEQARHVRAQSQSSRDRSASRERSHSSSRDHHNDSPGSAGSFQRSGSFREPVNTTKRRLQTLQHSHSLPANNQSNPPVPSSPRSGDSSIHGTPRRLLPQLPNIDPADVEVRRRQLAAEARKRLTEIAMEQQQQHHHQQQQQQQQGQSSPRGRLANIPTVVMNTPRTPRAQGLVAQKSHDSAIIRRDKSSTSGGRPRPRSDTETAELMTQSFPNDASLDLHTARSSSGHRQQQHTQHNVPRLKLRHHSTTSSEDDDDHNSSRAARGALNGHRHLLTSRIDDPGSTTSTPTVTVATDSGMSQSPIRTRTAHNEATQTPDNRVEVPQIRRIPHHPSFFEVSSMCDLLPVTLRRHSRHDWGIRCFESIFSSNKSMNNNSFEESFSNDILMSGGLSPSGRRPLIGRRLGAFAATNSSSLNNTKSLIAVDQLAEGSVSTEYRSEGLNAGDYLLEVNGVSVLALTVEQVENMLESQMSLELLVGRSRHRGSESSRVDYDHQLSDIPDAERQLRILQTQYSALKEEHNRSEHLVRELRDAVQRRVRVDVIRSGRPPPIRSYNSFKTIQNSFEEVISTV